MKRNVSGLCAIVTVLLTSGAINVLPITPTETARQLVEKAKNAVDAAHHALDVAQKAEQDKSPDAGKKYDNWLNAHEAAAKALAKAREAVGDFPEGSTKDGFTEQLNEQDAILKVLGLRDDTAVRGMAALASMQGKEKEAKEALNKNFNDADDAIQKLPPGKRKNLQKELDDLRKKYSDLLALGPLPGKATDTYASQVTSSSTTRDGLRVVTFDDTLRGRVTVNLPDDIRASDTISGTVKADPKGQTPEERAKNMGDQKIKIATAKKPDGTSDVNVEIPITATLSPFTFKLPPTITPTPPLKSVSSGSSGGLGITLTNTTGSFTTGGTTTVPIELVSLSLQSVAPLTVHFPTIGQTGRLIEITGPFQVNQPSTLMYGPPGASVQDFEKNTENPSGGFGRIQTLAKSPRECVGEAPTNVTGPIELYLKEGDIKVTAPSRFVGIKLTAPTTELPQGGSTAVTGEVTGVGGSQQPIPIHVECVGQVDMGGGNSQTLQAPPSSDPNAKFVFNLPITATKGPGPFSVTATVVVFNFCLQDESNGNQLSVNSTTGDYRFCNVFPTVVAGDSGRVDVVWYGTTTPETGAVTKAGCIITLQHNSKDGRVQAQIDRCTQTGNATIQPGTGKTKFTITDRNTTNNTCTCK